MNDKVEKIMMEDGRLAERRSYVDENGDTHIELWAEEPRSLKLQERITEKHANIVSERKIEKVNEEGEIFEVKVESVDPNKGMQLVNHIGVATDKNRSKYATKEELKEVLVAAMSEVKQSKSQNYHQPLNQPFMKAQSVVANNVENKKGLDFVEKTSIVIIGIGSIVLAYMWFIV